LFVGSRPRYQCVMSVAAPAMTRRKSGKRKSGKSRLDGCAFRDGDSVQCPRWATQRDDAGAWLCSLHMALARGESPPRRGFKTQARRLVIKQRRRPRRLRGKQKPPRLMQRGEACNHAGPDLCPLWGQSTVAGKRFCKAHAAEHRPKTVTFLSLSSLSFACMYS
jgi:hypothetical protein